MAWIRGNLRIVVQIIMAISMIEMCNGDNSKANEFLIMKWRMLFNAEDVNHDGQITIEDVREMENKFSDLEPLDPQQKEMAKKTLNKWYNQCIFRWGKEPIFEQVFVDSLKANFNNDTGKFVDEIHNCSELIISIADINEDKSISEDEFLIMNAAFGHRQIANDNDTFSAYNSTNGLVPLNIFVDIWDDFITSTDESKGNNVANEFANNGFQ